MKVVLIRPRPHKDTIGLQHVMICEPLELEYIAAVLEETHQVVIYDMILEKLSLKEILQKEKPDLVGISGYISHVGIIKDYARQIKEINPKVQIVVGGIHAEVEPHDFAIKEIDYILGANGLKNIKRIADGEAFEQVIKEEKETFFSYPHPKREYVERYKKHYYYMFHSPCALIKTSFGCPYHCEFCFCKEITDGHYFTRSIEDVLDELETIEEEEIYIVDDDFLFNEERLLAFYEGLKKRRIHKKYLVYGRADFIATHEDLIAKLGEVGLRAVIVGLESYLDDELDEYHKKSSIAYNKKAVDLLHKYGMECYGTFIVSIDWDKKDFKKLYHFIRQLNIQFVNLQPITPMPHTQLYETYKDKLIVPREDYHKWDMAHLVLHPTKLSIRQYYFQIVLLYYKITLHPKMVLRALKKYPFIQNITLSIGANKVMGQYIKKIIGGKL